MLVVALVVLLRGARGQDRLVEALAAGFQKSLGELTERLTILIAETQAIARQQESDNLSSVVRQGRNNRRPPAADDWNALDMVAAVKDDLPGIDRAL